MKKKRKTALHDPEVITLIKESHKKPLSLDPELNIFRQEFLAGKIPSWTPIIELAEKRVEREKKIKDMEPIYEHGKKFKQGPKGNRRLDALGRIMETTYKTLLNKKRSQRLTAKLLFDNLPIGDVIEGKEDDTIFWVNHRGKPKETSFKKFQDRLTRIKKYL